MIDVVAALIWKNGKLLICQRPANKSQGLLWEFVGGKVEIGETMQDALVRECKEELKITIEVANQYVDVTHSYPNIDIHLHSFNAKIVEGEITLLEHNDYKWIDVAEISNYEFCPADKKIIKRLKGDIL